MIATYTVNLDTICYEKEYHVNTNDYDSMGTYIVYSKEFPGLNTNELTIEQVVYENE